MVNIYIGPGVHVPQITTSVMNENKRNHTANTDKSASRNTTQQSKKYYCSYGKHGYNNSHNTAQCRLRKKIADSPAHPANPIQKMLRQEVARLAKKEFDAIKAKGVKKEDGSYPEKSNENVLARYSNAELKEKFEEFKKEMERRGIR